MKPVEEKRPEAGLRDPKELVQFNGRVPAGMKLAVKNAVYMSGIDLETALQDAWKHYLGVEDPMLEARRAVVLAAFKQLKGKGRLPFELPLTPNENNATLTSRGDSDNLAAPANDGVVAQLVEHHNGIVGTTPTGLKITLHIPKKSSPGPRRARIGARRLKL